MATATDSFHLADPDDRTDTHVVIYDGHCRFCIAQVKRLARMDSRQKLSFISLHDPRVAERYSDLSHDQLMANMYLVDSAGDRHKGAAAVRRLSRILPLMWPLAPILHFPGSLPIWQWMYQQVAKRRYRLGKTCHEGQCEL